jgi:integrase
MSNGYDLRLHPNGKWYIHWTEPDVRRPGRHRSKRHSTGETGREAAELYRAHWLIERQRAGGGRPTAGVAMTIDAALDDYLAEHVEVKCLTADRIRSKIANLKAFFAGRRIDEIDIPMCRAYVAARRHDGPMKIGRKPAADGTIRGELGSTLVPAINHAVRWKRLSRDAVPYVEMPAAPESRHRWLTHNELTRLLAGARERDTTLYRFVMLSYWTGARRRAIETLRRDQVDLTGGLIYLNPRGRQATNKRRPTIPVPPELRPLLEEIMAETPPAIYLLGAPRQLWYPFRALCDGLGLTDVTPHTLRHTRATHMLQAGKDPWAVAGLLGDRLQTIVDTYGHHCPEHLRGAI